MKQICFAAILLACSAAVHAQDSVVIYGTVDLGLWYQSKTSGPPPNVDLGSETMIQTGGIAPSVFGIRGQETLGNDLKAIFNLEGHMDASNGTSGLNALWARAANVGLTGSWGTVKVGQQVVPAFLAYIATDPAGGRESLSGLQPWVFSSVQNIGPGTATPNSTLALFASNSISYQQTRNGVYVGALYSFGEVPGNYQANRVASFGASYTGPFIVAGSFHTSKWASTGQNSDRKASIGVGMPIGNGTVKLNYLSTKAYASTGVMSGDWQIISFGGDYKLDERNTLIAGYYHGKNKLDGFSEDKAHSLVVSDQYSFSKRTILYGQLAAIKAEDAAGLAVSILGSVPVPSKTTVVLNIGVRHSF